MTDRQESRPTDVTTQVRTLVECGQLSSGGGIGDEDVVAAKLYLQALLRTGARFCTEEPDVREFDGLAAAPGPSCAEIARRLHALPRCGRCENDKDEKCLDRWLAFEPNPQLSQVMCGCGCWTRSGFLHDLDADSEEIISSG